MLFYYFQDDTDVTGNILNVSFSAKRPEAEVGFGGDTSPYYSPTHLRERVYLHRATLARLATVQVCSNYDPVVFSIVYSIVLVVFYSIVV